MAIEALLQHLEDGAAAEVARLALEAEEAAAATLAQAEAEAARRRELHVARMGEERRAALERRVAGARAEARARFLEARGHALARVHDRAAALLAGAPAARYASLARPLAREALDCLEGGAAELECPADAAAVLADAAAGRVGVAVRATGRAAGVLARSADGRVEVDNTLPALLARRRGELMIKLAARLEGDA